MVVNISSIYYEKQKLQSTIDQAALLGTNYIDLDNYYHNSLLAGLNLDKTDVQVSVHQYIREKYDDSSITNLKIDVFSNEVLIEIFLRHYLPFEIPFKSVSIKAISSAKLMVD